MPIIYTTSDVLIISLYSDLYEINFARSPNKSFYSSATSLNVTWKTRFLDSETFKYNIKKHIKETQQSAQLKIEIYRYNFQETQTRSRARVLPKIWRDSFDPSRGETRRGENVYTFFSPRCRCISLIETRMAWSTWPYTVSRAVTLSNRYRRVIDARSGLLTRLHTWQRRVHVVAVPRHATVNEIGTVSVRSSWRIVEFNSSGPDVFLCSH